MNQVWTRVLDHAGMFYKFETEGDSVEGILQSVGIGQNGSFLMILKDNGIAVKVGVSTLLEQVTWERHVGAMVRITFKGTEVSKTGRTYMRFDVDVAR